MKVGSASASSGAGLKLSEFKEGVSLDGVAMLRQKGYDVGDIVARKGSDVLFKVRDVQMGVKEFEVHLDHMSDSNVVQRAPLESFVGLFRKGKESEGVHVLRVDSVTVAVAGVTTHQAAWQPAFRSQAEPAIPEVAMKPDATVRTVYCTYRSLMPQINYCVHRRASHTLPLHLPPHRIANNWPDYNLLYCTVLYGAALNLYKRHLLHRTATIASRLQGNLL